MTTESSTRINGAITLSRMNLAGHEKHMTIFQSNAYYCMTFSNRVSVRIRFSVWLVGGYAHVT